MILRISRCNLRGGYFLLDISDGEKEQRMLQYFDNFPSAFEARERILRDGYTTTIDDRNNEEVKNDKTTS